MFLEKIELQGFKSFANKTALQFGKGITAIVGPNGSGKSNVADAIRWVLGEQSLKLIRGKKAEDAIFAGSDRKTKLGSAEVSLYLNNEDRRAPIDFSELVITRRVYRDGSGEYFVNKRAVRLQDIHMLLAKSNFGQRSYSVIGQGMVDSILATSPQERKHFFDEAAGVRQFQLKREQTVTKLEHTRENLRQAEALIAEIEPRVRSLTRQVRRLERRSEVEQALIGLQTRYYRGLLQDLQTQLERSRNQREKLETEQRQHEEVVNSLNATLSSLEREQSRTEAFAALQKQFEDVQAQKSDLLTEQAALQGRRELSFKEQGKGDVVWLEKQLATLQQQVGDLESEVGKLEQSISEDEKKIAGLASREMEKQRKHQALEDDLRQTTEALQRGTVSLQDVQAEFKELAAFERAFLEELKTITSLEALEAVRKRGQELDARTQAFAERLERVGIHDGASRVLELQEQLRAAFLERDEILKQLNELRPAVTLRRNQRALVDKNLERLTDERDRLGRELERSRAELEGTIEATLKKQTEHLTREISAIDKKLADITKEIRLFNQSETTKREELFRLQRELRTAQDHLNATNAKLGEVRVAAAKLETRHQDVEREIREEVRPDVWPAIFESTEPTPPPLEEQGNEILRLKHQLALIGGIDEGIEKEYKETRERYDFLKTQYDDLMKASEQLAEGIADLDRTIKERFDEAFKRINEEFGKYFRTLFGGGQAKLILEREVMAEEKPEDEEESEDAEEEGREEPKPVAKGEKVITGIEIQATPPGKRLKGIAMLSGGERALTSIALICAIIANNPLPFAVLDEVDAALDEANSQRFAAILEQLAHKTQFVTITHNRATMEKANILYGVTMGDDGVSRMLSVKLEEADHVIKRYGNR